MSLPTVTVSGGGYHYNEDGSEGELEYPTIRGAVMEQARCTLDRGTYALVRVADGQTLTAERRWFCGFSDTTIVRGDSFEYRRNLCLGNHGTSRSLTEWDCCWVFLVKGADMEETT